MTFNYMQGGLFCKSATLAYMLGDQCLLVTRSVLSQGAVPSAGIQEWVRLGVPLTEHAELL